MAIDGYTHGKRLSAASYYIGRWPLVQSWPLAVPGSWSRASLIFCLHAMRKTRVAVRFACHALVPPRAASARGFLAGSPILGGESGQRGVCELVVFYS